MWVRRYDLTANKNQKNNKINIKAFSDRSSLMDDMDMAYDTTQFILFWNWLSFFKFNYLYSFENKSEGDDIPPLGWNILFPFDWYGYW